MLPRDCRERFEYLFWLLEKLENVSVLPLNLSFVCLKWSILKTMTDIAKKLSIVPRKGDRDYFVVQIRMKSRMNCTRVSW